MNKYLVFLIGLVLALVVVSCQSATTQSNAPNAPAPVETVGNSPEAKPTSTETSESRVSVLGTYRGEYSDKQKARWKEQNLETAEVRITFQENGEFQAEAKFITSTAQSVFSFNGKFNLEGDKLTMITEKSLEDGMETSVDSTPFVLTVTENGKNLISPPEEVAKDLSTPDRFVKE